jgi:hypothetical protein
LDHTSFALKTKFSMFFGFLLFFRNHIIEGIIKLTCILMETKVFGSVVAVTF